MKVWVRARVIGGRIFEGRFLATKGVEENSSCAPRLVSWEGLREWAEIAALRRLYESEG